MAFGEAICACCGAQDGIEKHHLYLKSDGCPDDLTVWLCHICHGLTHGMKRRVNINMATKAGLARARERGVKLGGWRGGPTPDNAQLAALSVVGSEANRKAADAFAATVAPILADLNANGLSLAKMAAELTKRGIATPRGGSWTATAVRRVLLR